MKRKTIYLLLSFLILFAAIDPVASQTTAIDELYKLPDEYCLVFVSLQKSAPVQFAGIEALVKRNGVQPVLNWTLKNNSSKTVRRFQVAFKIRTNVTGWQGTGGQIAYDVGTDEANDLILPNGTYTEFTYPTHPFPVEIRNLFETKNKSEDKRLVIVYGMIKKVVFSDGSVFEDDNGIFQNF